MTLEEHYRISFYEPVRRLQDEAHIWLVRHTQTGKFYVRKELTDYNREVYECLRRLDSIWFPHICELVEDADRLIVIEEYISGQTLEEYMQQSQRLTLEQTISVLLDLCEALQLLHQQNPPIIHRDMKPSNVILSVDGIWKIVDFNTARYYDEAAQRDTTFLGTMEYAAPEQFGDLQTDVRTDIYALGAMMNYLLTGRNHKKYLYDGPAGNIILKCTRFDPNLRYQSVDEFRQELKQLEEYSETEKKKLQRNTGKGDEKQFIKVGEEPEKQSERARDKENDRKPDRKKQQHRWTFWLPPGFRTLKLWKMCLAGLVYAFLFWCCLTMEVKNENGGVVTFQMLLANRGGSLLLFLSWIFFWFNYGGIHRFLPLVRRKQIGWKILGYAVWTGVICMVIMTVVVLLCV